jgi:malate dehydrogenase (quinone)
LADQKKGKLYTKFVFIGAGGGSLPLLEKQMFQKERFWQFPRKGNGSNVSIRTLLQSTNQETYSKAVGAPPMSVPHIDSRMIKEKTAVVWPFCWFSTDS